MLSPRVQHYNAGGLGYRNGRRRADEPSKYSSPFHCVPLRSAQFPAVPRISVDFRLVPPANWPKLLILKVMAALGAKAGGNRLTMTNQVGPFHGFLALREEGLGTRMAKT